MNFLQLCQEVARESGTVQGTQPTSVTGQTGRLLEIVQWTSQAWDAIQGLHDQWLWMTKEFSALTTASSARYTDASWSLDNFRDWRRDEPYLNGLYRPHSLYLEATGVADEGELLEIPWEQWRFQYGRGSQTNQRPAFYAISPQREFCLGPIPDDEYRVLGEYWEGATSLSSNTDEPGMPARYHNAIVFGAIILLAEFDESKEKRAAAANRYDHLMAGLARDQLPKLSIGGGPVA